MVDYLNKDLPPLIEECFQDALPFLFRKDLEQAVRDHVEVISLKYNILPDDVLGLAGGTCVL